MTVVTFRQLHHGDRPFVLPNAWDVASALAFAEAGYPAIGTTSFGLAAAAGDPDGDRSAREATRNLVGRLRSLPCHLTADVEDGYSDDPAEVAEYVASLDVAGVNLEDSLAGRLVDPARHAAKIAAVKARVPDVFVNARVDTYWSAQDVPDTLARAQSYVDAGADGVFVPGPITRDALRDLAAAIPVPLNVLPILPLGELAELGVRRVSTGSLPHRAAIDTAVAVAATIRDGHPAPKATPYPDMQARLTRFQA